MGNQTSTDLETGLGCVKTTVRRLSREERITMDSRLLHHRKVHMASTITYLLANQGGQIGGNALHLGLEVGVQALAVLHFQFPTNGRGRNCEQERKAKRPMNGSQQSQSIIS